MRPTFTTILKLLAVATLPAALVLWGLVLGGAFGLEWLAATLLIVAVHTVIALGQATAWERGKARWLMLAGLVVCGVAAVAWLWVTWDAYLHGANLLGLPLIPAVLTGWAAMVMVAGMALSQAARGRIARGVQYGTVALAVGLAALWVPTAQAVVADSPDIDRWGRLVAVLSLLAVAGLLANLVLARSSVAVASAAAHDDRRIDAACPRCGHWQTLRLNGAACDQCGLRIKVQIP